MNRYGQVGAEPFEEQWRSKNASQDTVNLTEFYKEQEKKDHDRKVERKQSGKRRSGSLWRRKSSKEPHRSASASASTSDSHTLHPPLQITQSHEREMQAIEETTKRDRIPLPQSPRSVVPEIMSAMPAWYAKDHSTPLPPNIHYNIHNPVGPRLYRNHHLLPPSANQHTRTPSFFSPDFPPMASSSSVRLEDTRTPARSPTTPTATNNPPAQPDSGVKPRSRKTSQTAADNVDMLDASDPWGQNFHHHSPYDISTPPETAEVTSTSQTRSRHSSMTAPTKKHRAVTPSPLSQSTSAVHLKLEVPGASDSVRIPRRLSKRRTPVLGFFGGRSAPDQPASTSPSPVPSAEAVKPSGPKRISKMGPPPSNPSAFAAATSAGSKAERRGSVLGRLAKKFSLSKKSSQKRSPSIQESNVQAEEWHRISADDARVHDEKLQPVSRISPIERRTPSPQKLIQPPAPLAPLTTVDVPSPVPPPNPIVSAPPQLSADATIQRNSITSLDDLAFSIGQLMVANPDVPSAANTPIQANTPLSPAPTPFQEAPAPRELAPVVAAASQPQRREDPRTMSPSPTPNGPDQRVKTRSPTKLQKRSPPEQRAPSPDKQIPLPSKPLEKGLPSTTFPTILSPSARLSPTMLSTESPESSSSVLANPPTPKPPVTPDFRPTPSTLPPPLPEKPPPAPARTRKKSREPSPGNLNRTTETFKLVRSASGNVYASSETIRAAGQQWEVVESEARLHKSSASLLGSKDATPSRRESRQSMSPSKKESRNRSSAEQWEVVENEGRLHKSSTSMLGSKEARRESKQSSSPSKKESRNRSSAEQWEIAENEGRLHRSSASMLGSKEATPSRRESRQSYSPSKKESRNRSSTADYDQSKPRRPSIDVPVAVSSNSKPTKHGTVVDPTDYSRPKESSPSKKRPDHDHERGRQSARESKSSRSSRDLHSMNQSNPSVHHAASYPKEHPHSLASNPSQRPLERNPSTSVRPSSELVSSRELNDTRAREAWELERLFKGRSMYGAETVEIMSASSSVAPTPPPKDRSLPPIQNHGSSHTSFLIQTPFQPPAPIPPRTSRRPAVSIPQEDTITKSTNNPLPSPPQESPFQPAMLRDSDPKSAQYWAQYAGVTTSH